MAGLSFTAVCPESSFSTSLKTMLVLAAAAQQRVLVREWSVSFIGTSNTAQPIKTDVYNIASGGSLGTGTSATTVKWNQSDAETIQTTANYSDTVEPTGTKNIAQEEEVHPQTGFCWQAPFGGELAIKGGTWLGMQVTAAAGTSCAARFVCSE